MGKKKRLSKEEFRKVKEQIFHRGSFLEKEGYFLEISGKDLEKLLQKTYDGGRKNSQYKDLIRTARMNASRVPPEKMKMYQIQELSYLRKRKR